jgi:hypothetical protein
VISLPISQPLTDNPLQRAITTGHVINAERNAVAVTEIKLGKIAMQVLFGAVLVNALNSALENRVIAFNRVRVDVITNILFSLVVHRVVAKEPAAERFLPASLIRHHNAFAFDVVVNDREQVQ